MEVLVEVNQGRIHLQGDGGSVPQNSLASPQIIIIANSYIIGDSDGALNRAHTVWGI